VVQRCDATMRPSPEAGHRLEAALGAELPHDDRGVAVRALHMKVTPLVLLLVDVRTVSLDSAHAKSPYTCVHTHGTTGLFDATKGRTASLHHLRVGLRCVFVLVF
jgi:hypothetical protein